MGKIDFNNLIRVVPDFPKVGINFLDIIPLLYDNHAFSHLISEMATFVPTEVNKIVAIESRGFILGAALANHLNIGLVLLRKKGKTPGFVESEVYELEYGQDQLEISSDLLKSTDNMCIVDDVLATGGTLQAACKLVNSQKANLKKALVLIEIESLLGRESVGVEIDSLLKY